MESAPTRRNSLIIVLSAANFFAALGGGTILGKGMGVLSSEPMLKGDSLVALVGGTTLGFVILLFVKKWGGQYRASIFALATGLLSLVLFAFLPTAANSSEPFQLTGTSAWLFFAILTSRWACWYVGRSLRGESAGYYAQRIPTVECFYFIGIMSGLVVWNLSGYSISLRSALLIDFVLQLVTGLLDAFSSRFVPSARTPTSKSLTSSGPLPIFQANQCLRLGTSVIVLTVGVQIVIFAIADKVGRPFGSQLVAAFYGGAALAAAFCSLASVKFYWENRTGIGWIEGEFGKKKRVPLAIMAGISSAMTTVVVLYSTTISTFVVLSIVTLAAFFLGITTLALFNHVAFLAREAMRTGIVALVFGTMGLVGTVSLVTLVHLSANSATKMLFVDITCLIIAIAAAGWLHGFQGDKSEQLRESLE